MLGSLFLFISLFFIPNSQVQAASISSQKEIILNDKGFSTDELSINVGTKIVFNIGGDNFHWPASNFHPTHGEYPQQGGCIGSKLDACHPMKKGETYSFVFKEPGNWGMHDHLFPGFTTTIEVKEKQSLMKRLITAFMEKLAALKNKGSLTVTDKNDKISIFPSVTEYRKLSYKDRHDLIEKQSKLDPELTWNYLKKVSTVNGKAVENVHEFAHLIGHQLYKKYSFSGMRKCDSLFGFGCFHGVTEAMLLDKGVSNISEIEVECVNFFTGRQNQEESCVHGLGHGLLTWNGLNLNNALKDCDRLSSSHRSFCYEGTFMEYIQELPKLSFDIGDPWKLCVNLGIRYQERCAAMLPDIVRQKTGFDINRIDRICDEAPDSKLHEICVRHVVYQVGRQVRGEKDSIITICKSFGKKSDQDLCIMMGAQLLKLEQFPNWQQASMQMCEELTDVSTQNTCTSKLNQFLEK
ncbi:MAG TPA: hypothetical protein VM077_02730 [Candidatus Limnocylindrales bacterium]|nr:hypothetical protein [Candidatus Limnocylindrales bacterium]